MNCFEFDLNKLPKVTRLYKESFNVNKAHITRYTSEYVIYYVLSGCMQLVCDTEKIELRPGEIYVFPPGVFQKPYQNADCEFYYIHFSDDCAEPLSLTEDEYFRKVQTKNLDFFGANTIGDESYRHMKVLIKQKMFVDNDAFSKELINFFESNLITNSNISFEKRYDISVAAAKFLISLESAMIDSRELLTVKNKLKCGKKSYENVRAVIEYVIDHFKDPVSSTDIEKNLLINFDYANRIFKKIMGCSILKYRNQLRIEFALGKLLSTDMSISEIAEEAGFSSCYYFSRTFRQFMNATPTEYRNHRLRGGKFVR